MGEFTFKNKERKKILMKIGIMIFVIGLFSSLFTLFSQVNAAENTVEYVAHEVIPGNEKGAESFVEYLNQLYKFGIGIAAVLALGMIAFGAFSYVVTSAGNATKMGDAKGMIFSAVLGLTLAMVSWLLLYLINPDLVGKLKDLGLNDSAGECQDACPEGSSESEGGSCPEGKVFCMPDDDESCEKSEDCKNKSQRCLDGQCVTPCEDNTHNELCGNGENTGQYRCWDNECVSQVFSLLDEGCGPRVSSNNNAFRGLCKMREDGCSDGVVLTGTENNYKQCASGLTCCQ